MPGCAGGNGASEGEGAGEGTSVVLLSSCWGVGLVAGCTGDGTAGDSSSGGAGGATSVILAAGRGLGPFALAGLVMSGWGLVAGSAVLGGGEVKVSDSGPWEGLCLGAGRTTLTSGDGAVRFMGGRTLLDGGQSRADKPLVCAGGAPHLPNTVSASCLLTFDLEITHGCRFAASHTTLVVASTARTDTKLISLLPAPPQGAALHTNLTLLRLFVALPRPALLPLLLLVVGVRHPAGHCSGMLGVAAVTALQTRLCCDTHSAVALPAPDAAARGCAA